MLLFITWFIIPQLLSQTLKTLGEIHDRKVLHIVSKQFYYSHSTRLLAATTLRNVLGTKNLSEILSEREVK